MSTSIEWTHPPGYQGDTWNPVVGCSRKSTGCEHCYAEVMASRIANSSQAKWRAAIAKSTEAAKALGGPFEKADDVRMRVLTPTELAYQAAVKWKIGGSDGPASSVDTALRQWSRKLIPLPHMLSYPLKKRKPTCFFVNSMSDLFHESVPFGFIDQVFAVMAMCPQHIFQILTKRTERMAEYMNTPGRKQCIEQALLVIIQEHFLPSQYLPWLQEDRVELPNVWLGTSVENQKTADERIPHLLRCRAAVRFLSMEPLLGPVDLMRTLSLQAIQRTLVCFTGAAWDVVEDFWVIIGGESGHGARPFVLGHAKDLVRNLRGHTFRVFVKQIGANAVNREGVRHHTKSKKGGDPNEWPEELRVQEWPHLITQQAVPA